MAAVRKILRLAESKLVNRIECRCGFFTERRHFSNESKEISKIDKTRGLKQKKYDADAVQDDAERSELPGDYVWANKTSVGARKAYWFESRSIKKAKKNDTILGRINSMSDAIRELSALEKIVPMNWDEFVYALKKYTIRRQMLSHKYLPERTGILKPDIATGQYIVARGGSVKFIGHKNWTNIHNAKNQLPFEYIPGFHVEGIDAEKTDMCYEGLQNIEGLTHLKTLKLRGNKDIDDWCMDWISYNYPTLVHLDISQCKNVTHRGLSCFYRFENLKTLNVEGVSDAAEFKVACLMLQDIMPDLVIEGISLTVPEEIEPVETASVKD